MNEIHQVTHEWVPYWIYLNYDQSLSRALEYKERGRLWRNICSGLSMVIRRFEAFMYRNEPQQDFRFSRVKGLIFFPSMQIVTLSNLHAGTIEICKNWVC